MNVHTFFLLLFAFTKMLCASENFTRSSQPIIDKNSQRQTAQGKIYFDYSVIRLPHNKAIDLLGTHYLQKLNNWFYLGFGLHSPLLKGDYGGFMALDITLHMQQQIYKDFFVNGGVSLGGGGGGSSIEQSKKLSGSGGFIKSYVGLGYNFTKDISFGVHCSYFKFKHSQIDDAQVGVFIQTSVEYFIYPYKMTGKKIKSTSRTNIFSSSKTPPSIFTLELNNIVQVKPQKSKKMPINTISIQYTHFLDTNYYLFFEAEAGYKGLPLYNHIVHGLGYKTTFSSDFSLYSQLGIGSGGYSPHEIDTGSGLLVYPKLSLEYLLSKDLGLVVSSGYLYAPTGTSKNYTVGTALNYYLNSPQNNNTYRMDDSFYKGIRFSMFMQNEFYAQVDGKQHHDIYLLSTQMDNLIGENWYFPLQISFAYNDFLGYPGYGEILAGIGFQSKYSQKENNQYFFQMLLGTNIGGLIVKPTIGMNYTLTKHYALYGKFGYTTSINSYNLYKKNHSFQSYVTGFGLTYRFSLD